MRSTTLAPEVRADLALQGLSLGDAFGERFFGPPGVVLGRIARRELPPGPWAWTDDTEMALSVRDVLARHGRVDQDVLAEAFAARFAADRHRGYGAKAQEILEAIAGGTVWQLAAASVYDGAGSLGNGGAMRVAPVGAYFADDLGRLAREARASAEITHAHPEGQAGAVAVAAAAAWAARAEPGPLLDFAIELTPVGATRAGLEAARAIPFDAPVTHAAQRLGSGQQVSAQDTVPFALWCAARHADDFVEAMWSTVSGLGDRDTTCAIVGGVVALRVGPGGLPEAWLAARPPLPPPGTLTAEG